MVHVNELMSAVAYRCNDSESANRAAQLMWDHDCGCVPVVDALDRVVGIVTDRDLCMAAYTQGKPLTEIPLSSLCSRDVKTCRSDDTLEAAERLMIEHQVRRLPVTDEGGRLLGVISLSDLAKRAHFVSPAKEDGTGVGALARVIEAVSRRRDTIKAAAQAQRSAKRSRSMTA